MTNAVRFVLGTLLMFSTAASARPAEPKSPDAIWSERIEAGCKAEAKKYYSAVHFTKRKLFIKRCMDRAYR